MASKTIAVAKNQVESLAVRLSRNLSRSSDINIRPQRRERLAQALRCTRKLSATILLLFSGPMMTTTTVASTPAIIAVWSCNPCSSLSDLQTAAQQTALKQQWSNYNGALILMTSLNEPISAYFQLTVTWQTAWGTRIATYTATPITPTNIAAGALDNSIFARAAAVPAIIIPPSLPYNETDELISGNIASQLLPNGQFGTNYWHGITNFPQVVWYKLVDSAGNIYQVYVGDTITVKYGDSGYSEQWQFFGPNVGGSIEWQRVPNTLMLNGKPVNPPSNKPATSIPNASSFNVQDQYSPGLIQLVNDLNFCTGVSSVTAAGTTSYGSFSYPC
jgi:hypothetical protein